MHLGLLDILQADHFRQQSDRDNKLYSVQQHLLRLFNARQGSLCHLPDYGLPDVNQLFQDLPKSARNLSEQVAHLIQRYEPRLINVKIIEHKERDKDYIVAFDIQATLVPAYPVLYSTYFLSGGCTEVLQR